MSSSVSIRSSRWRGWGDASVYICLRFVATSFSMLGCKNENMVYKDRMFPLLIQDKKMIKKTQKWATNIDPRTWYKTHIKRGYEFAWSDFHSATPHHWTSSWPRWDRDLWTFRHTRSRTIARWEYRLRISGTFVPTLFPSSIETCKF